MKLIIGLGNPGKKYQDNRHNVGHMFIDHISQRHSRSDQESDSHLRENDKFVKTTVFMNHSGAEVKKLATYYKLPTTSIIVVHDDLDIPLGKFKIQKSGGPKLHNGITSIEKTLKTKGFWRVRIGVDNRDPDNRIDGETYILQDLTQQERKNLLQVFDEVVDKLKSVFHNELIP